MTKNIISLPKELSHFDELVKSSVQSSADNTRCLTVMRCIPYTDKDTWNEIYSALGSKEWFAVEVDLENMNDILEPLYQKTKEYEPKLDKANQVEAIVDKKSNEPLAQCIVHAHEKHFLFFGKPA